MLLEVKINRIGGKTHFTSKCATCFMKKSTNARVRDSQKRIADALLFLLNIEAYEKITITQLTQEAEVSRKTFYRNFDHKAEVVTYLLHEIFDEFQKKLRKKSKLSNIEITKCYFDVWYDNTVLLKLLLKNDLMHIIYQFHNQQIKKLYPLFYCSSYQNRNSYWHSIISGTYYSLLEQWIKNDFSLSPTDIADLHTRVVEHLSR